MGVPRKPRRVAITPICVNSFQILTIKRKRKHYTVNFLDHPRLQYKYELQLFGWLYRQIQEANKIQIRVLTEVGLHITAELFIDGVNITEQLKKNLTQMGV